MTKQSIEKLLCHADFVFLAHLVQRALAYETQMHSGKTNNMT